jgi:DNA helicase MCM8
MSDDNREAGRIPRTVECDLTADLVDSCVPGDLITVTAIVKATKSDEGQGRNNKDKCMFLIYLSAVSVTTSRGQGVGEEPHMEFSTKVTPIYQSHHSITQGFYRITMLFRRFKETAMC